MDKQEFLMKMIKLGKELGNSEDWFECSRIVGDLERLYDEQFSSVNSQTTTGVDPLYIKCSGKIFKVLSESSKFYAVDLGNGVGSINKDVCVSATMEEYVNQERKCQTTTPIPEYVKFPGRDHVFKVVNRGIDTYELEEHTGTRVWTHIVNVVPATQEEYEAQENKLGWPILGMTQYWVDEFGEVLCGDFGDYENVDNKRMFIGNTWKNEIDAEEVRDAMVKLFKEYREKFGY